MPSKTPDEGVGPLPALRCRTCSAAAKCPQYEAEPGAECFYESFEVAPNLATKDGMLALLRDKVGLDFGRFKRETRIASMSRANGQSRNLTGLSREITNTMVVLAQLSAVFEKPGGALPEQPLHAHLHGDTTIQIVQVVEADLERIKAGERQLEKMGTEELPPMPLRVEQQKREQSA